MLCPGHHMSCPFRFEMLHSVSMCYLDELFLGVLHVKVCVRLSKLFLHSVFYLDMYICMYEWMYVCMYVYSMYVCMYVFVSMSELLLGVLHVQVRMCAPERVVARRFSTLSIMLCILYVVNACTCMFLCVSLSVLLLGVLHVQVCVHLSEPLLGDSPHSVCCFFMYGCMYVCICFYVCPWERAVANHVHVLNVLLFLFNHTCDVCVKPCDVWATNRLGCVAWIHPWVTTL